MVYDLPPHMLCENSNGTAPRSFVISSEIYGQPADTSTPLVFEDTPITLTFTLELVRCLTLNLTNLHVIIHVSC